MWLHLFGVLLPGGTYWLTSLAVSGTLTFSGPATLYIKGPVTLGSLQAYNGIPANLMIYQIGSYTFGGGADGVDVTADIEAPGSDFDVKNNCTFRGRMLFSTITFKNNCEIYYDEDLGPLDGSSTVTIVQ